MSKKEELEKQFREIVKRMNDITLGRRHPNYLIELKKLSREKNAIVALMEKSTKTM